MRTNVFCLAPVFPHLPPDHIFAETFFRRMHGGSQSILIRASDGKFYVLKFADNPQGPNTLFNEAFGSVLAEYLGLPVPSWHPIEVGYEFIEGNSDLHFVLEEGTGMPRPGLHFGSNFVMPPPEDEVYEIVPHTWVDRIENPSLFARMFLLDLWTENVDRRQVLFIERSAGRSLDVVFFDHGHMFGGPHGDKNLRNAETCLYHHRKIYEKAFQSAKIEPWLRLIEGMTEAKLRVLLEPLPPEWRSSTVERNAVTRLLRNQASLRQRANEVVSRFIC